MKQKLPSHQIPELLKAGQTIRGQYVYVKWVRVGTENTSWQVVAPVKVVKKAVARNTVKRQLREIVRQWWKENALSGVGVLVVLKRKGSFAELKNDVEFVLRKIN